VRYARASTLLRPIDDELYDELTRHFDTRQIIELCMTVGLANQVNRFHATFLTDLDEATEAALGSRCPLPLPPRAGNDLDRSGTTHPDAAGVIVSSIRDLFAQKGLASRLSAAAAAIAMAQERERQRLAADLHDDVGQLLSLVCIKIGMLGGSSGSAEERLRDELAERINRAQSAHRVPDVTAVPADPARLGLAAASE